MCKSRVCRSCFAAMSGGMAREPHAPVPRARCPEIVKHPGSWLFAGTLDDALTVGAKVQSRIAQSWDHRFGAKLGFIEPGLQNRPQFRRDRHEANRMAFTCPAAFGLRTVRRSAALHEYGRLLTMPILYLSRSILSCSIIEQKQKYDQLLLKVTTDAAWEEWLLYMIAGVEDTAKWTTAKVRAMRHLFDHTSEDVRTRLPKVYSDELINQIFEQPYCRIKNVVDAGIVERQAASKYLNALAEIGVLQPIRVGREKLFISVKLLLLLTRSSNEHETYI